MNLNMTFSLTLCDLHAERSCSHMFFGASRNADLSFYSVQEMTERIPRFLPGCICPCWTFHHCNAHNDFRFSLNTVQYHSISAQIVPTVCSAHPPLPRGFLMKPLSFGPHSQWFSAHSCSPCVSESHTQPHTPLSLRLQKKV